jgi:hypothetical protein
MKIGSQLGKNLINIVEKIEKKTAYQIGKVINL